MTRRARSGNTQKHQKMPEDPTPWSEFSKQMTSKTVPEKKLLQGDVCPTMFDDKVDDSLVKEKLNIKACNSDFGIIGKKRKAEDDLKLPIPSHDERKQNILIYPYENKLTNDSSSNCFKKTKETITSEYSKSTTFDAQFVDNAVQKGNDFENNKLNKFKEKNVMFAKTFLEESMKVDNTTTNNSADVKQCLSKKKYSKKPSFLEIVKMNRQNNGIPLLPTKVERRLYNIKKRLRRDGVAGEEIKQIIRQVRRKEENHIRHSLSKICYNCREAGHIISECPNANNHEQGTGICYKCGSTEHISAKCILKISGFPLATCFVCREQGHITRDCPQNKLGIYPKGGKCDICGNVNHLKKDCPTIKKAKEDNVVTAHTITEVAGSVDAELIEERTDEKQKEVKTKKKIVKFK